MRQELGPTLALAGPVIVAELGWVSMGIVDTMVVGPLGAAAIGAVSLGTAFFFTAAVFGMGMLLGLDTLVSQAHGAGRRDDCHRSLVQGLYLALALTPLLTLALRATLPALDHLGLDPTVRRLAVPYLRALTWSLGPLLVFAALRRYTQSMGRTTPIVVALVGANVVNLVANAALVHGRFGAPKLGVAGSGWATTLARVFMLAVLALDLVAHDRRHATGFFRVSFRPDRARFLALLALGLPAAGQVTLEMGVFALATTLAARLDATSLAAHQVVLCIASFTFMIPFGLSSAAAIRVGQAIGRKDHAGAARAGWMAILLGAAFMALAGLTLVGAPRTILGAFTTDPAVLAVGRTLLALAAGFQLFDGLQVVATGALRGAGETRVPMLASLLAYWVIGLPVGAVLAFQYQLGVLGLWAGLAAGIIAAALILVAAWTRMTRSLDALE